MKRIAVLYQFCTLVLVALIVTSCSNKLNRDGPAPEGDMSPSAPTGLSVSSSAALSSSSTLTFNAATPMEGEIATYHLGLGTSSGADDVIAFTDVGNFTSVQFNSISPSLSLNTNYYLSVYAIDDEGRQSSVVSSDPWVVEMATLDGAYHIPETPFYLSSCTDYIASPYNDGHSDGLYWIDPDGAGGIDEMKVYCDQTTDGGGWQLVTNYFHQGGTNPANNPLSTSLPIPNNDLLGDDGSLDINSWGHAGNTLLTTMVLSDIRFYCESSLHSRMVHFKTSLSGALSYIQSGLGNMSPLASNYTALSGHSAGLPGAATSYFSHRGDEALIAFPFYIPGGDTWSIGRGSRWECDDYANGSAYDTLHQVWVR